MIGFVVGTTAGSIEVQPGALHGAKRERLPLSYIDHVCARRQVSSYQFIYRGAGTVRGFLVYRQTMLYNCHPLGTASHQCL